MFNDKNRFAVIGLGETGLSIIGYLKYKKANIVKVLDTRSNPPNQEKIRDLTLKTGPLSENVFDDVDIIVISPGVSIYEPLLQNAIHNGKKVLGDIELFALAIKDWKSAVIGITGSNGKTTVTSLTGHLSQQYGYATLVAGNIGTPVLDSYLEIIQNGNIPKVIVLELSSFQLETTYSLKLVSAVTLNISEDHLDRYRDLLEYAYVKANIFNNCDVEVLNADDPIVRSMTRHNKKIEWFGEDSSNAFTVSGNELVIDKKNYLPCNELNLVGRHNYYNVLASLALLKAAGIDIYSDKIKNGLKSFQGLEHRMQKITTHNGILYVEDSKGTNVGAVVAGLSGLDCKVHLILGGDGKGQDFSPLRSLVEKRCNSVAIIGQDKLAIQKVLEGLDLPIELFNTLQEAVKFCSKNAKSGECVLLSPACASWDMFDNYKHRAQVFVESVYANIV